MTEVRNTYVDLVPRETAAGQKTGGKTSAEEVSGFKNMIKSKSEKDSKKDSAPGKLSDEKGTEKETKASDETKENVLGLALAASAVIQEKQNAEPVPVLIAETAGSDEVSAAAVNPFQAMEQLRFKKLAGQEEKGPGISTKTEGEAALKGPGIGLMPRGPEQGVKQKENASKAGEEKNIPADIPVRPDHQTAPKTPGNSKGDVAVKRQTVISPKEEKNKETESVTLHAAASETVSLKTHVQTAEKLPDGEETVTSTLKADSPQDLEAKLSEQLMKQVSSGKKELDIQLEPYNLGKIRIKVSYEDNQTSVSVLCSESSTLKLLSKSAGELGSILESNLERPVEVFVDKQEADYLNNQQEGQNEGQQQQQHRQEGRRDSSPEDFIQKLRLGISGTEQKEEAADYR